MKTLLTIIVFYVTSPLLGQINYRTITPGELNEEIKSRAAARWTSDVEIKFIGEVIDSERQELLAVCFKNASTRNYTLKQVVKMPKGINRERAAITLLRTSSGYWPDDDNPGGGFTFITVTPGHLLVEPFISTMTELLPQEKLELHHMLSTKERMKLADRLEAALQKKVPAASPPPAVPPIKSETPEVKQVQIVPQVTPKSLPPPPVEAAPKPAKESESRSDLPIWLPITAIVALGLWLVSRKK